MSYPASYRYKRKRVPKKAKILIIVGAVLAAVIVAVVFFQKNVTKILYRLSEASVQSMTVLSVNEAVSETLERIDYDSLITVTHGNDGAVTGISANAQNVNLLARTTATLSMANLSARSKNGIKVPVGAFTGIEFLAGFGPKVTFKIISVSRVSCEFESAFSSAGVNQTRHSVYMDVEATVTVVMPSGSKEISSVTEVLVAESVIVGEVPDVFLQGDIFGERYDLVP